MPNDEPRVDRLVSDLAARRIDRRQFVQRALALGISLPGAGALMAACGGDDDRAADTTAGATTTTAGEAAEVPDTLKIRLVSDISNLDPAFYPSSVDEATFAAVSEGLVTYKPGTFEIVNQLAETFEPSADGLSYEFKLKEGMFWQGYGEVTAEDVKYSYERIAGLTKPKLDSPYAGDWAPHLKEVTSRTSSPARSSSRSRSHRSCARPCHGSGIVCPRRRSRSWARSSPPTRSARARTSSSSGGPRSGRR